MVEFKKGYWNIAELEINEWYEPKQDGFQKIDVMTLQSKILEEIDNEEIKSKIRKHFGFED